MIQFDESKAGKDAPENLIMTGIAITGDFEQTDSPYRHIPQALNAQMSDLHDQAHKGKVQVIQKLERLIERYPNVPALYNYLSIAYMVHENQEKFMKINELTIKRFPDYPIAKMNQATRLTLAGKFDEAEALLGQTMDINAFIPTRKIFHISEVFQFYETTTRFFIHKRDFKVADSHLNLLKKLSAKNNGFQKERIKKLEDEKESEMEDIRFETLDTYSVEGERKPWVDKSATAPTFTHPEIGWLYENSCAIEKEKIDKILALPRPTLIEDLHKVLDDAMARFDHFNDQDWEEETHTFPIHALFLLAELRSAASLSHVLNLIRQDDEWTTYWFADLVTESFPMHFYKMLGDVDFSVLKNYLLEPANEPFQRMVVPAALVVLAHHHPEKRSECIAFLEDMLNDFYDHREQYEDIIDIELNGAIVSDLIELNAEESYPTIEKLYAAYMLADDMAGDLSEIKKALSDVKSTFYFDKIPTIYDDYQMVVKWNSPMPDEEHAEMLAKIAKNEEEMKENKRIIAEKESELKQLMAQQKSGIPKVGRNDPCPCGSGKKYKKCHGG
jgi:tetratricopeptide (TPR) repeat protein